MCDGYSVFVELFPDPQEERLGVDCRGFRFVRALFESARLREHDA